MHFCRFCFNWWWSFKKTCSENGCSVLKCWPVRMRAATMLGCHKGRSWLIMAALPPEPRLKKLWQELSTWIVCNAMKRGKMCSCCPYLSMLFQFIWFSFFKSRHAAGGAGFSTVCLCWNSMFILYSVGELKRSAIISSLSKAECKARFKKTCLPWMDLKWFDISTNITDSIAWALATWPMALPPPPGPPKKMLVVLPCWLEKICAKEACEDSDSEEVATRPSLARDALL